MDIVGRLYLVDGTEVKVVTGVDDHSRYCVCARIVARAMAKPVCDALTFALEEHGPPDEILTDNGKVFTARFGPGPGPVLFDRICHNFGIKHRLTAPYSPTTTGKVERFHRTYRDEFVADHDRKHATIEEAQEALDAWVRKYNTERPHQSLGDRPPAERFALAAPRTPVDTATDLELADAEEPMATPRLPGVSRWVDQRGLIGLGSFRYRVGATFAGESVEVVVQSGLVEILHKGVLIATHAERRRDGANRPVPRPEGRPSPAGQFRDVRRPIRRLRWIHLLCRDVLSGGTQLGRSQCRRGHRGRIGADRRERQGRPGPPDPP